MGMPRPPKPKWHFEMVSIDKIVPDEVVWAKGKVEELKKDIQKNGIRHTLKLRKNNDGTYMIEDGCHRLQALRELGFKGEVPAMIYDVY